jgi:hypothetical protein
LTDYGDIARPGFEFDYDAADAIARQNIHPAGSKCLLLAANDDGQVGIEPVDIMAQGNL